MAAKPISMQKLRLIFQHLLNQVSQRGISSILQVSRPTIRAYIDKSRALGLSYQQVLTLSDIELKNLFCDIGADQKPLEDRYLLLIRDLEHFVKEKQRVGVTLKLLWQEYRAKYPHGYAYSQFCYHIQQYRQHGDVTMHFVHTPAEIMEVDFAGKTMRCKMICGTIREYQVFIAILPYSGYSYVQAVESQKKEDFVKCVQNAFRYFGGTPRQVVTDNLKASVIKADRYEPQLNELFEQLSLHYGVAIMPTRVVKPRDKASVEKMVNLTYQRIYAPLRDHVYRDINEVNNEILTQLDNHHQRKFRSGDTSRQDLFEQDEKRALTPLPSHLFILKKYKSARVQKNYHVVLGEDWHAYSVPWQYVGKKVMIQYTDTQVEIYHEYSRIAVHCRNSRKNHYTTLKEHMPVGHQLVAEQRGWNADYFLTWASRISPDVVRVIEKVLQNRQFIEQTYRACIGILSLEKQYGKERLSNACQLSLEDGLVNYKRIKTILQNKRDQHYARPIENTVIHLYHENIRNNYQ